MTLSVGTHGIPCVQLQRRDMDDYSIFQVNNNSQHRSELILEN